MEALMRNWESSDKKGGIVVYAMKEKGKYKEIHQDKCF